MTSRWGGHPVEDGADPTGQAVFASTGAAVTALDLLIAEQVHTTHGTLPALLTLGISLSATWIVCGAPLLARLQLRRFDRAVARMTAREHSRRSHPAGRRRVGAA